ncbi:MAG: HAMP domain-containing protein, partial [Anaerolineae bacterium]|nr:HAMP domain-containing protein [Anaerolineae bacterium]
MDNKKEESAEKCDASWREKRWERWQHFPYRHARHESKSRFLWLRFIGFFLFISIPLLVVGGFVGARYRMDGMMPVERYHSPSPFSALFCIAPFLIIGLLAFLGTRAFRKMGMPLANVMTAADAVAEGDLSVRVPERGAGEFRRLSESFNRMVDELARADQQRRNMTADVAHELRTPIHILRGNLEGILDGVYEATPEQIEMMLDETSLLTRLVDDLQTI